MKLGKLPRAYAKSLLVRLHVGHGLLFLLYIVYIRVGFPFLRFLLVLSCLGQAASLAQKIRILWFPSPGARRLAACQHPPSWGGHQRGGAPDHSANRLGRRAISAMFHRPTLLTSTCTREVEVSLTPTLILARRAGSEKSRQKPEFGHRVLIERPVLRA